MCFLKVESSRWNLGEKIREHVVTEVFKTHQHVGAVQDLKIAIVDANHEQIAEADLIIGGEMIQGQPLPPIQGHNVTSSPPVQLLIYCKVPAHKEMGSMKISQTGRCRCKRQISGPVRRMHSNFTSTNCQFVEPTKEVWK